MVREVWLKIRDQRNWCHKMVSVLDKSSRRLQPRAERMLREIMYAETRAQAEQDISRFLAEFVLKYGKATACLA
jgi:putative transposase